MQLQAETTVSINSFNRRSLFVLGIVLGLGYLLAMAWLAWNGKKIPFLLAAAAPCGVALLALPRTTLYLFVALLFVPWVVMSSPYLSVLDLASVLIILTSLLDMLLHVEKPKTQPRLFYNYLLVVGALLVAGLFGYNVRVSVFPLARVTLLFLTFLAVYRLARYVSVLTVLRIFFWSAVIQGLFAVLPFLASAGRIRSFGLLPATLDDLTMLALPIGLVLYLWSEKRESLWSLAGTALVLGALLATQSRASILFSGLVSGLTLLFSWRVARQSVRESSNFTSGVGAPAGLVVGRIRYLVLLGLVLVGFVMVVQPESVGGVLGRFERLISKTPADTVRLRTILWKQALQAFKDHPILGIGPGNFRRIQELYPTLHLNPLFIYFRGLSAHNLLLHYLAETGLVGGIALVALFGAHLKAAWENWRKSLGSGDFRPQLILFMLATLFFVTMLMEAGWMWGQTGCVTAVFFGLTARLSASANVH